MFLIGQLIRKIFYFVEIISSGYLLPLPERDEYGRQVILSCAGKFDPYKHTSEEMARTHSLVCEVYIDDEESQVAGYSYVNDESGLSMGLISLWSLSDIRTMIKCIQVCVPRVVERWRQSSLNSFFLEFYTDASQSISFSQHSGVCNQVC